MALPRPGCVVRSALVSLGVLFLPMSIWFAYADWSRNWFKSIVIFAVSIAFLKFGLTRDRDSWIATIDEMGGSGEDR